METPINFDPNAPDFSDLEDFDATVADGEVRKFSPEFSIKQSHGKFRTEQPCPKCRGTGKWHSYSGYTVRECFRCHGTGKIMGYPEPSPEEKAKRLQAKLRADARKQEREEAAITSWADLYPRQYAWLLTNNGRFDFATSLLGALRKYGSLTDGQLAAVDRCLAKQEARVAVRETTAVDVSGAGFERLLKAFQTATANGLKYPKITIGDLKFSPAKATSNNAGSLYVKSGEYLGKISPAGKLYPVAACTDAQKTQIAEIGRDPMAAAIAHGLQTGRCACCGLELTNPESVARGIGPICAGKYGW